MIRSSLAFHHDSMLTTDTSFPNLSPGLPQTRTFGTWTPKTYLVTMPSLMCDSFQI